MIDSDTNWFKQLVTLKIYMSRPHGVFLSNGSVPNRIWRPTPKMSNLETSARSLLATYTRAYAPHVLFCDHYNNIARSPRLLRSSINMGLINEDPGRIATGHRNIWVQLVLAAFAGFLWFTYGRAPTAFYDWVLSRHNDTHFDGSIFADGCVF